MGPHSPVESNYYNFKNNLLINFTVKGLLTMRRRYHLLIETLDSIIFECLMLTKSRMNNFSSLSKELPNDIIMKASERPNYTRNTRLSFIYSGSQYRSNIRFKSVILCQRKQKVHGVPTT